MFTSIKDNNISLSDSDQKQQLTERKKSSLNLPANSKLPLERLQSFVPTQGNRRLK